MTVRAVKLALLAAYLGCDHHAIADRVASLGLSFSLLLYIGLYAALAAGLAAAAFIPSLAGRLGLAALFAAGSVMLHSYEWATGTPLDYNSFVTMVASAGDAGNAAAQHGDVLLRAVLAALLLFLALALPPRGRVLPYRLHWALPAAALLGLGGMLYVRGGEGARALPAAYAPVAEFALMGVERLADARGPRKPVAFRPIRPAPAHDVVLIVDESVAANYLDINHPAGVRSGLAAVPARLAVYNYGIAASVTNCSAGSNRTLRFGGTRETYRAASKVQPSIWAYARAAGLRTVYLDGQRSGGVLQNLATPEERAEIDDFVQLSGVPVIERDHVLARLLAGRIGNGRAEFIYVNKIGAHFPVADKFPYAAAQFRPLPPRGRTRNIIDMGPVHGSHKGTPDEWRLYRNAYRNTLAWNVGGFFDVLLPRLDPAKAVVIYTSDHGQDLHERGNPGKGTHCTADPLPEEGAVPLVVIDSAAQPRLDWQAALPANRDHMSHFRIFPTLLALMGYAPRDTLALYGPPLTAPAQGDPAFTVNYFAALGREPVWTPVARAKLAAPPPGDFAPKLAAVPRANGDHRRR